MLFLEKFFTNVVDRVVQKQADEVFEILEQRPNNPTDLDLFVLPSEPFFV